MRPELPPALGVTDECDDRQEADRDDQPRVVGQAFPRQEEGRRQDGEEQNGRDLDLDP